MASLRCCAGGKADDRNGCGNQPRGVMRDIAVYALACWGLVGGFFLNRKIPCARFLFAVRGLVIPPFL